MICDDYYIFCWTCRPHRRRIRLFIDAAREILRDPSSFFEIPRRSFGTIHQVRRQSLKPSQLDRSGSDSLAADGARNKTCHFLYFLPASFFASKSAQNISRNRKCHHQLCFTSFHSIPAHWTRNLTLNRTLPDTFQDPFLWGDSRPDSEPNIKSVRLSI